MKNRQPKKEPSWKESRRANMRALRLLYEQHPQMILSQIFYAVWQALTPYVGIYLSALLIDEIAGGKDRGRLTQLVIASLVTAAVIALGTALLTRWQNTAAAEMPFVMSKIFADKMLDMDYVSVDNTETHELFYKIQQNEIGGGFGLGKVLEDTIQLISAVMTLFGGAALSVSLFVKPVPENAGVLTVLNNPLFILVIAGVMIAVTYLSPVLANKAESYMVAVTNDLNLNNRLFGFWGYLGQRREIAADIRIYRQDMLADRNVGDKKMLFGSEGKVAHLARGVMGLCQAASAALSVVFVGVVYLFVCLKAWAGAFGVGAVTQYIGAITKLSGSVSVLIKTVGSMKNNAVFLKPIYRFLDIPNAMHGGAKHVEHDSSFEIEFRDVSFRYPGSDNYVLKHVNMKFNSGTRMAIVGQNGSGKTTFIKLLCRLYDPTEGEILLNGKNIKEYDYEEYMDVFSVVFQDFKLFSFPIGQNVSAKMTYDRKLAEECIRKAGFGDRYDKMDKGLDTYLYKNVDKNGVDVSGGEAQKIALARTLYKDAPLIILDEPTAALDPIAESEVYSSFNSIVGDKTAIYISHRLSSCRFCSDIAVFHNGELVQRGSHEQLVGDRRGKYYELWSAQAQYYAA